MSAVMQAAPIDLRNELANWKERLEATNHSSGNHVELDGLLREVNAAIERLSQPESYGVCQVCHEMIGQAAMSVDPLARNCLSCFTAEQLRELERDLDRAWLIQGESLPKQNFRFNGWQVAYIYEPAGPVSGDYCDLVSTECGDLYFMIGDVSGKGVAASLLMSRLHAIFRSLIGSGLGVADLVERANRIFADSTMRPYYATLVCGKASATGDVEICNAGHCPPLLVNRHNVVPVAATGLPVGMFSQECYSSVSLSLEKGDRLFLYTDGLSESQNPARSEYGAERLLSFLAEIGRAPFTNLIDQVLNDAHRFSSGTPLNDDLTLMTIELTGH